MKKLETISGEKNNKISANRSWNPGEMDYCHLTQNSVEKKTENESIFSNIFIRHCQTVNDPKEEWSARNESHDYNLHNIDNVEEDGLCAIKSAIVELDQILPNSKKTSIKENKKGELFGLSSNNFGKVSPTPKQKETELIKVHIPINESSQSTNSNFREPGQTLPINTFSSNPMSTDPINFIPPLHVSLSEEENNLSPQGNFPLELNLTNAPEDIISRKEDITEKFPRGHHIDTPPWKLKINQFYKTFNKDQYVSVNYYPHLEPFVHMFCKYKDKHQEDIEVQEVDDCIYDLEIMGVQSAEELYDVIFKKYSKNMKITVQDIYGVLEDNFSIISTNILSKLDLIINVLNFHVEERLLKNKKENIRNLLLSDDESEQSDMDDENVLEAEDFLKSNHNNQNQLEKESLTKDDTIDNLRIQENIESKLGCNVVETEISEEAKEFLNDSKEIKRTNIMGKNENVELSKDQRKKRISSLKNNVAKNKDDELKEKLEEVKKKVHENTRKMKIKQMDKEAKLKILRTKCDREKNQMRKGEKERILHTNRKREYEVNPLKRTDIGDKFVHTKNRDYGNRIGKRKEKRNNFDDKTRVGQIKYANFAKDFNRLKEVPKGKEQTKRKINEIYDGAGQIVSIGKETLGLIHSQDGYVIFISPDISDFKIGSYIHFDAIEAFKSYNQIVNEYFNMKVKIIFWATDIWFVKPPARRKIDKSSCLKSFQKEFINKMCILKKEIMNKMKVENYVYPIANRNTKYEKYHNEQKINFVNPTTMTQKSTSSTIKPYAGCFFVEHDSEIVKTDSICLFQLQGGCTNKDCEKQHDVTKHMNLFYCPLFLKDSCKNSNKCGLLHVSQSFLISAISAEIQKISQKCYLCERSRTMAHSIDLYKDNVKNNKLKPKEKVSVDTLKIKSSWVLPSKGKIAGNQSTTKFSGEQHTATILNICPTKTSLDYPGIKSISSESPRKSILGDPPSRQSPEPFSSGDPCLRIRPHLTTPPLRKFTIPSTTTIMGKQKSGYTQDASDSTKKLKTCWYFKQGTCSFGEKCRNLHIL